MTELTPISRKRVKVTAKKQLSGNFLSAFKANWLLIIYNIFQMIGIATLAYIIYHGYQTTGEIAYLDQQNDYFVQTITGTIGLLFTWSAKWTIVDYFQKPKEKVHWRQSLQAFRFHNFVATVMLAFVQNILLFIWSLLFIPLFIKPFSYSQTYYAYKMDLLFDRRQKSLTDYITISRKVMDGRKMELFKLELSFIGWHILGILTFGLAYIYVTPYLNTCRVVYSSQAFAYALQKGES
ncbi:DUF975 family protein [Fructobacillus ficulneus]|uniref:Integral membrane protein n=1 Tax=Fructobacillus ficulneus TaxID=157463 RepID=A0A0K8MGN2_9LACO|nr:DUF975 family protein [Fructobacillus ficulneus]GAO99622.1 integral membrane protein [Fructobacillus ficulneus]